MTIASTIARPATAASPTRRPSMAGAVVRSSTWSISTRNGITVAGYLPSWAAEDPSKADVLPQRLLTELIDVAHWSPFDGQPVHIHNPAHADDDNRAGEAEDTVFSGNITCYPHSEDIRERTPYAGVRVVGDLWINHLTPADVVTLAAKLRSQADYFEKDVAPALERARSDWVAHRPDHEVSGSGDTAEPRSLDDMTPTGSWEAADA